LNGRDIQSLRGRLGYRNTESFAAFLSFEWGFTVSPHTLRHWEQGDRNPHPSVMLLFKELDMVNRLGD